MPTEDSKSSQLDNIGPHPIFAQDYLFQSG